jgi:hypothetical protein
MEILLAEALPLTGRRPGLPLLAEIEARGEHLNASR